MGRNARLRTERRQEKGAIAFQSKYVDWNARIEEKWQSEKEKALYWLNFGWSQSLELHVGELGTIAMLRHRRQVTEHLKSLLAMSLKSDWKDRDRSPFFGENRAEVMRIGYDLSNWGGIDLMRAICLKIPSYDQRELDMAWHGIGDWLS